MNPLRWLFGKRSSDVRPQYLRRAGRIQIQPLHRISFFEKTGQEIPIANLSKTGIALLTRARNGWPNIGAQLEGRLSFGDASFPVTIRLVHFSEQVVGCQFAPPNPEVSRRIELYFGAELQALELTEVDPATIRKTSKGKPRWFTGGNNSELYFISKGWGKAKTFKHLYLCFFGSFLEITPDNGLRTGHVTADHTAEMLQEAPAGSVSFSQSPDMAVVATAMRFIPYITALEPETRKEIEALLRSYNP